MLSNMNAKRYVTKVWPLGRRKRKYDMEGIKKYYKEFNSDEYGDIDEQSFADLNLQSMYIRMDGTYSTAGETKLYELLKKPVRDKKVLEDRSKFMEHFGENDEERIAVQSALYSLGRDKHYDFADILTSNHKGNNIKKTLYFFLGSVLPILLLITGILYPAQLYILFGLLVVNSIITSIEKSSKPEKPRSGIAYIAKLVKCGKKISKLDIKALEEYKKRIDDVFEKMGKDKNKFNKSTGVMGGVDNLSSLNGIKELWAMITLSADKAYYGMVENLNDNKDEIKELYDVIGEIDALISVQGYKESVEYEITKPKFEDGVGFKIVEGAHPLIEGVVKNSISIENKGIVLTGSNMAGKSTFLRMIGVNIVFAQSFNFVFAKEYKSEFLNYVSSISPEDDVEAGKSYYIAEAEAVLRIIKALKGKYKVFCGIDEIFRGTNPVERIAASEKILEYIQKRKSLSIVATHDKELTDMLGQTHDFYHFSEAVSESEGLTFDYKLKDGVLKTRNAIKLLKYIGYPDEIVDGAYRFIENEEASV